ncbi:MAG: hypothetical protein ABIJ84_03035 [bacterium]
MVDDTPTSDIISEILLKYELEESIEQLDEKFFVKGGESNGGIVLWVASEWSKNKIAEKDVASLLAEKLNTSKEIAEKVKEDIKTMLLPILIPNKKFESKPEIVMPSMPIDKKDEKFKIKKPKEIRQTNHKIDVPEKTKFPKRIEKRTKESKKADTYREPIE